MNAELKRMSHHRGGDFGGGVAWTIGGSHHVENPGPELWIHLFQAMEPAHVRVELTEKSVIRISPLRRGSLHLHSLVSWSGETPWRPPGGGF